MIKLIAALGMSAIAACGGGKMTGVQQQVSVDAKDGKVVVHMAVENGGKAPVYVANAVFKDEQLFGRAFDITNLDTGAPVQYIGPMVKRGPLTAADFIVVEPAAKHSHAIDITRSYEFKAGQHNYQLTFAGNYLGSLAKLDAANPVAVVPVKFTFTGK